MPGFIKHSHDCTEIVTWTEVSHAGLLDEPGDGYAWTLVPLELGDSVGNWTIVLNEDEEPVPAPRQRSDPARLALAQIARWEEVKRIRDIRERGGCMTPKGPVDTDPDAQLKINGLATMAMLAQAASQPFELYFTMASNEPVAHDAAEVIALGQAVGAHVVACHARSVELRALLNDAADVPALEAIDILTGWP